MHLGAQEKRCCDSPNYSINIPVFLVDGVEVYNIDSLLKEDIIKIEIIKDENVTKYFYPRVGGLVLVTTKSKKYLKPILLKHKENAKKIKTETSLW